MNESPKRLQQRDQDAHSVNNNDANNYGYKKSICIDAEHGFARRFIAKPANNHDSQIVAMFLDPKNKDDYVWADSAYSGKRFKDLLSLAGFENKIHAKGSRSNTLTAAAIWRNSIRSQIRARVKHIFTSYHINGREIYKKNWNKKE